MMNTRCFKTILLALTFLLSMQTNVFAQSSFGRHKIPDISLKHSVKQDGLQYNFEVLDKDKKGVRNHDKTKFYYWFKSQKVMATQGGSSGQLLHGQFESFYTNKQLQQKGNFEKGLKNGEWNYWRENGTLLRAENWKNGTLSGMQINYNEEGIPIKNTHVYWNKHSEKSLDSLVEIKGKKTKITLYDADQKTTETQRFKKGVLHGKQHTFEAGKISSTVLYRKGELKEKQSEKESKPETATDEKTSIFSKLKQKFKKEDKEKKAKPEGEKKKIKLNFKKKASE
jgi:antitoxin component YwqK of YwqJK toxin-antitoxin module